MWKQRNAQNKYALVLENTNIWFPYNHNSQQLRFSIKEFQDRLDFHIILGKKKKYYFKKNKFSLIFKLQPKPLEQRNWKRQCKNHKAPKLAKRKANRSIGRIAIINTRWEQIPRIGRWFEQRLQNNSEICILLLEISDLWQLKISRRDDYQSTSGEK